MMKTIYKVELTEQDVELIKSALESNTVVSIFGASIPASQRMAIDQRVKQITDKLDAAEQIQVRS